MTTMAKNSAKSVKTQREKFEDAARELGTDDSEERFDRVLKKVAKSPPPKDEKQKKGDPI
ncbi:hypothetical protein LB523_15180 [Mesorhizobium sp. ESP-6-4]|uniref:hypothetical protein n=1 Tax=Mesorhizobium sp. ESP-6-4 TaxID=2876624 RepID=UPI001CCBD348|nr:hypothetical protein [Mesorhizobium sp. ESP-6-4]MBZ9660395.1 hypothetical protein [Mesorhizobium sp. ESP-6-4]